MGRRSGTSRSAASSAAAAAAKPSSTPFTSFAAATAQALGTPSPTNSIGTEWDIEGLAILKKLSKRDAKTKLRALQSLLTHLEEQVDGKNAGTQFLVAWADYFKGNILNEEHAGVRKEILRVMVKVVKKFGKGMGAIFGEVLPGWIAAGGDVGVGDVAKETLSVVLQGEGKVRKVVSRYDSDLRKFCVEQIQELGSGDQFQIGARRVVAVVMWLVKGAGHCAVVDEIIDQDKDPLLLLAKGSRKKGKKEDDVNNGALKEVCELCIVMLHHMQSEQEKDMERAKRFTRVVYLGIRKGEPSAWDLLLVLLKGAWYDAFQMSKLADVVADAVSTALPSGMSALLPVFGALPSGKQESVTVANRVLRRMKTKLYPNPTDGQERAQGNVSYIYSALQAYVECASFAYTSGSMQWSSDATDSSTLSKQFLEDYIVPAIVGFLQAAVPPSRKSHNQVSSLRRRKDINHKGNHDLIETIARILHELRPEHVETNAETVVSALLEMPRHDPYESVSRFELLLDRLKDGVFATALHKRLSTRIVDAGKDQADVWNGLALLSVCLSMPNSRILLDDVEISNDEGENMIARLMSFSNNTTAKLDAIDESSRQEVIIEQVAQVYSWVIWAGCVKELHLKPNVFVQLNNLTNDSLTWALVEQILKAHRNRKTQEKVLQWSRIQDEEINGLIWKAAQSLNGSKMNDHAHDLVIEALVPSGAVDLPYEVRNKVASMIMSCLTGNEDEPRFDDLIITFLNSTAQEISENRNVHDLVPFAVLRAMHNENVLDAIERVLAKVPAYYARIILKDILDVVEKLIMKQDEILGAKSREAARCVALLVSYTEKHMITDCFPLCGIIISWKSTRFITEIVTKVPLKACLVESETLDLKYDRLLDVLEAVHGETNDHDAVHALREFVTNLTAEEQGCCARLAAQRFLYDQDGSLHGLLGCFTNNNASNPSSTHIYEWIAEVALEVIGAMKTSQNVRGLDNLPHLISISVSQSEGGCIPSFQLVAENLVKVIRRNPLSSEAFVSLSVISELLWIPKDAPNMLHENNSAYSGLPWVKENVFVILTSVRKCLERPMSATKKHIHVLETHGALLMGRAMISFGPAYLGEADLRFWTLRTHDILASYTKLTNQRGKVTVEGFQRLSNFSLLGHVLTSFDNSNELLHSNLVNEILHFGAWSAVCLLPLLDDHDYRMPHIEQISQALSSLVLNANKHGMLTDSKGQLPIDADLVYSLTKFLGSQNPWSRKTVFVLILSAAAVDLVESVSESFPKDGFQDEQQEAAFASKLIPKRIRSSLNWPLTHDIQILQLTEGERNDPTIAKELGYFYAWHLFFDLIGIAQVHSDGSQNIDEQEDFSFRRVATTYLRSQSHVFWEFLKNCIDVAVDGSLVERTAASAAAIEVLEEEQDAVTPQGVQLAKLQIDERNGKLKRDKEKHKFPQINGNFEEELGRVAGIVFAKALQRLPALSRQYVTDVLDRATSLRVEDFVRKRISPSLVATEIRKVKEWGAFGGGVGKGGFNSSSGSPSEEGEGELHATGSVAGGMVRATYTFSDVTLEISIELPDTFPLQIVQVQAQSGVGMSESRWRKTLLGMRNLLQTKDGTLAEAVELWRRNLDKTFQGAEECPICYSVLHLTSAAVPKMKCGTCKNKFHAECLFKWFKKSNSSSCPMCRSPLFPMNGYGASNVSAPS